MLNGHTDSINSVAFSSDGNSIVSGSSNNSVCVWDALIGKKKYVLNGHTESVNSVAFSSDGSCIISGSSDTSVQVWDVLTGKEKHVLNGHTNLVTSVAFSSNGSHIVSGSWDNSVQMWNVSTSRYIWEEITTSIHGPKHTGWLLSPHGEGYLMFVQPGERLPDDANILTIPHSYVAHVNFTTSRLGPNWSSCYSP